MRRFLYILVFILLFSSTYAVEKFGYKISKEDAFLYTQGNIYLIQSSCIVCSGNMLYFAAKDFTNKKDLLVAKTEKVEVVVDKKDRKIVKLTFSLEDNHKKIYPEYKLVVYGERNKKRVSFPCNLLKISLPWERKTPMWNKLGTFFCL